MITARIIFGGEEAFRAADDPRYVTVALNGENKGYFLSFDNSDDARYAEKIAQVDVECVLIGSDEDEGGAPFAA